MFAFCVLIYLIYSFLHLSVEMNIKKWNATTQKVTYTIYLKLSVNSGLSRVGYQDASGTGGNMVGSTRTEWQQSSQSERLQSTLLSTAAQLQPWCLK